MILLILYSFKRGKFFLEGGTIAPNAALQLRQRLIWLELIEVSPFVGKLIRGVDLYLQIHRGGEGARGLNKDRELSQGNAISLQSII